MFYWIIRAIAWPLRVVYFRIEAEGLENFPRRGPAMVVANHSSYLDAGVLGSILPRKVHFIVLSRMYAMWRIRWFYIGMDTIPVQPGRPDHRAVRRALEVLRRGGVLGIFPEGSRSTDGQVRAAQAGAALLALRSGAPVVPVGIRGAYEAFPPGSIVPRPRKIRVRIGRPFDPPPAGEKGRGALESFSERMMQEIAALLDGGRPRSGRAGEGAS